MRKEIEHTALKGIIAGVGKGFLRVVRSRPELVGDLIPVEYPIHLMLAAGWDTATTKYLLRLLTVVIYNESTLRAERRKLSFIIAQVAIITRLRGVSSATTVSRSG